LFSGEEGQRRGRRERVAVGRLVRERGRSREASGGGWSFRRLAVRGDFPVDLAGEDEEGVAAGFGREGSETRVREGKNWNEAALHGCGRRGEKKRRGEKRRLVAVRKGVTVVLWFSGDGWGCSPEFIEIMVRRRSS
ncbi:hypothetical protein HAX54_001018, partial [Datura stramonium]|nr:hypothetical protein [Datura stramonium]